MDYLSLIRLEDLGKKGPYCLGAKVGQDRSGPASKALVIFPLHSCGPQQENPSSQHLQGVDAQI